MRVRYVLGEGYSEFIILVRALCAVEYLGIAHIVGIGAAACYIKELNTFESRDILTFVPECILIAVVPECIISTTVPECVVAEVVPELFLIEITGQNV